MYTWHNHISLVRKLKAYKKFEILLESYKKPKILLTFHKTLESYKKWPNLIRKHDSYKIPIRSYSNFLHKGMQWHHQWRKVQCRGLTQYRIVSKNLASLIFQHPFTQMALILARQSLLSMFSAPCHPVRKRYKPVSERGRWGWCCSKLQVSKAHRLPEETPRRVHCWT